MYKLFLTFRYLFRKWIAVFAVLSVWLCVAMVLIVFSVMDGFLDNIKNHSRGLLSDIVVDNATLQGFPYYEEFTAHLKAKMPEVEHVTPVIYNYGIMRIVENESNFTKPVRVVGIRLEEYAAVNTFETSLYYDKYYPGTTTFERQAMPYAGLDEHDRPVLPPPYEEAFARFKAAPQNSASVARLSPSMAMLRGYASPHGVGIFNLNYGEPGYVGDELPGLIIGTDLIFERDESGDYKRVVPRGARVILTILPLTIRGTFAEDPVPIAMRYVDDSRTRVYEIDSLCVYVDFAMVQKLLSMGPLQREDGSIVPARTSQLLISLRRGTNEVWARAEIAKLWDELCFSLRDQLSREDAALMDGVSVETWEERQRPFIRAVEKEKVLVTVLFGIISVVAIVLIGVIFHMIVLQKTRDIGILKSIGASGKGVASIFILYGAVVGVIGGILGVISGSIFVHYINEVQDLLARLNPNLRVWSPDVYTFDRIPNEVKRLTMVWVFGAAVATAMIGALWPARRAASVWPVKALRYE